jgi:Uma2 family endonuclease
LCSINDGEFMNVASTQAAEGLRRRAFTVADVRRMVEIGVITEDERIELIEGEFVVMAAKGYAHEIIKNAFIKALVLAAEPELQVGVEMSVQFAPNVLLEPDIVVFARSGVRESETGFVTLERGSCLLIVEVAQSNLGYDRGRKGALYAELGVKEFWVVDTNDRATWVHTGATGSGWSSITKCGAEQALITPALPGVAIKLAEIE